jgi:hypothetical protein
MSSHNSRVFSSPRPLFLDIKCATTVEHAFIPLLPSANFCEAGKWFCCLQNGVTHVHEMGGVQSTELPTLPEQFGVCW